MIHYKQIFQVNSFILTLSKGLNDSEISSFRFYGKTN